MALSAVFPCGLGCRGSAWTRNAAGEGDEGRRASGADVHFRTHASRSDLAWLLELDAELVERFERPILEGWCDFGELGDPAPLVADRLENGDAFDPAISLRNLQGRYAVVVVEFDVTSKAAQDFDRRIVAILGGEVHCTVSLHSDGIDVRAAVYTQDRNRVIDAGLGCTHQRGGASHRGHAHVRPQANHFTNNHVVALRCRDMQNRDPIVILRINVRPQVNQQLEGLLGARAGGGRGGGSIILCLNPLTRSHVRPHACAHTRALSLYLSLSLSRSRTHQVSALRCCVQDGSTVVLPRIEARSK